MDRFDDSTATPTLDEPASTPTRKPRVRGRTISIKRLSKATLFEGRAATRDHTPGRPQTRTECENGPRPCPWVSCAWHLALDVNPRSGAIKINHPEHVTIDEDGVPELDLTALPQTCALDVADRGGATLEDIGLFTNLTRERVRQLETRGLAVLKPLARLAGLQEDDE